MGYLLCEFPFFFCPRKMGQTPNFPYALPLSPKHPQTPYFRHFSSTHIPKHPQITHRPFLRAVCSIEQVASRKIIHGSRSDGHPRNTQISTKNRPQIHPNWSASRLFGRTGGEQKGTHKHHKYIPLIAYPNRNLFYPSQIDLPYIHLT